MLHETSKEDPRGAGRHFSPFLVALVFIVFIAKFDKRRDIISLSLLFARLIFLTFLLPLQTILCIAFWSF
jgi:hypothetical protein